MNLTAVERRVVYGGQGERVLVTLAELDALLANVAYRPSLGQPPAARHFRRSLVDGTCLHLVIDDQGATLHLDRYDPHGGPASFLAHLGTDAPHETLSFIAAVGAVLRRLASR